MKFKVVDLFFTCSPPISAYGCINSGLILLLIYPGEKALTEVIELINKPAKRGSQGWGRVGWRPNRSHSKTPTESKNYAHKGAHT